MCILNWPNAALDCGPLGQTPWHPMAGSSREAEVVTVAYAPSYIWIVSSYIMGYIPIITHRYDPYSYIYRYYIIYDYMMLFINPHLDEWVICFWNYIPYLWMINHFRFLGHPSRSSWLRHRVCAACLQEIRGRSNCCPVCRAAQSKGRERMDLAPKQRHPSCQGFRKLVEIDHM